MRAAVWIACVVGMGMLAVVRMDDRGVRTTAGVAGYITGGVLIGIVLGWIAWAIVSAFRRTSPGFPIWVPVIGLGIVLVITLGTVVARVGNEVRAQQTNCLEPPKVYGAAPAGFSYQRATAEERKEVLKVVPVAQFSKGRTDVQFAFVPEDDESVAALLAVPWRDNGFYDPDEFADGADDGPHKVSQSTIGDYEVVWIDYTDGSSAVIALKGCQLVWVVGQDHGTAERLGKAVFGTAA